MLVLLGVEQGTVVLRVQHPEPGIKGVLFDGPLPARPIS